jgi:formate/nitrite transporter FocA (FNT family)
VSIFFLSLILAGTSFGVIIPSMTTIASSIADDCNSKARLLKMYTFGLSIGAVISALLEGSDFH